MGSGSAGTTMVSLAAASLVAASGLSACSAPGRSAAATADQFVSAWQHANGPAMAALVDRPAPGFAASVQALTVGLHATSVTRTVTALDPKGSATISSVYRLADGTSWSVVSQLPLGRHSGTWMVDWSPAAVLPGLQGDQRLAISYQWAPRAAILGVNGAPLTTDQDIVVVGIEGSRIKDPAQLTQVLESAGAPASAVTSALAAAAAHQDFFEPVFDLTDAQYQALGGQSSSLYSVAGTVFEHKTARQATTPGLAAHLVGSVGPATAEQLSKLGPAYAGSVNVGQSGLEAFYQGQLAGSPGLTVEVTGASTSAPVRTIVVSQPVGGTPVQTTIDPAVQSAAESSLNAANLPSVAALVAVRVSTGQVLASVSSPASNQFDFALNGSFPPGSTFKVLTASALFEAGLGPDSPASCPPQVTVDGAVFHNAEGDSPVATIAQAFTESCNTALVQLASSHLQPSNIPAVAAQFGLGQDIKMGYPAVAGSVPAPVDGAALAAAAIGQASVSVSPLDMAMVAAAVGSGTARPARLVAGAPDDTATGTPLPAAVLSALRPMMASVVTSGTAANTGLPSGTFAKTGTAQYGSGNPLPTDAWLIGYRGDVAFAMVVQASNGNGGPVDGPIVARFLGALPS